MEALTDKWEWDAETGEVVALDVADKRGGEAEPVDFSDEPVGRLAAAAPDMARALALAEELVNAVQQGHRVDEEFLERAHATINGALRKAGVIS